jgi:hypothetical protein
VFLSALGVLFSKRLVKNAFKERVAESVCPGCELNLFLVKLSSEDASVAQFNQIMVIPTAKPDFCPAEKVNLHYLDLQSLLAEHDL